MSYMGKKPLGKYRSQLITGSGVSTYTLNYHVHNEYGLLVFVGGAPQRPYIDYTANNTSITFKNYNLAVSDQAIIFFLFESTTKLTPVAGEIDFTHISDKLKAEIIDVEEGTSGTKIVTPYSMSGIFFSKYDQTGPTPTTVNTNNTIPHSLGVKPKLIQVKYVCSTSQYGWAPGDVVFRGNARQEGGGSGFSFVEGVGIQDSDEDNIYTFTASSAASITRKDTGAMGRITPANWSFILEVFA